MKFPGASLLVIAFSIMVSALDCLANDPVVIASGQAEHAPKQPQTAVGTDDSVHIVYGTGEIVQYVRSVDGGATFEKPRQAFQVPKMSLGL